MLRYARIYRNRFGDLLLAIGVVHMPTLMRFTGTPPFTSVRKSAVFYKPAGFSVDRRRDECCRCFLQRPETYGDPFCQYHFHQVCCTGSSATSSLATSTRFAPQIRPTERRPDRESNAHQSGLNNIWHSVFLFVLLIGLHRLLVLRQDVLNMVDNEFPWCWLSSPERTFTYCSGKYWLMSGRELVNPPDYEPDERKRHQSGFRPVIAHAIRVAITTRQATCLPSPW